MPLKVIAPQGNIVKGTVIVPLSKSESNRALLIKALAGFSFADDILSDAEDTLVLKSLLHSTKKTLDAKDGGTTARFLIAYCVFKNREATITGSPRLRQRPMDDIVNLLSSFGAQIEYTNADGFLPVKIKSSILHFPDEITVDAVKSSQHISALMMCAPVMPDGLIIRIQGTASSFSYLKLTAQIMQQFGATVSVEENKITITNNPYQNIHYKAGGDWSAASYFFEIAALSEKAEIKIKELDAGSAQGDKIITELIKPFGVSSEKTSDGIILRKEIKSTASYFTSNFFTVPDIALTMAAICCGLNMAADLPGLQNLRFKESDRVSVFQRAVYKLNIKTDFCDFSKLKIFSEKKIKTTNSFLKTSNDHRIAMCLAPLALKTGFILLDDETVVKKSFAEYWSHLKNLGFNFETLNSEH